MQEAKWKNGCNNYINKMSRICPQHLEIRNLLTKVSETFE